MIWTCRAEMSPMAMEEPFTTTPTIRLNVHGSVENLRDNAKIPFQHRLSESQYFSHVTLYLQERGSSRCYCIIVIFRMTNQCSMCGKVSDSEQNKLRFKSQ